MFNLVDVALIVVVAFFSLIFCVGASLFIYAVARHGLGPLDRGGVDELGKNVMLFLPAQVASYLLTVGFMALLLWQKYHVRFLSAIRWNAPPRKTALKLFALGAGMALVSELLSVVLQRWIPKSLPIEQFFRDAASAYALAIFGTFIAPVAEEIFFRGLLFPTLVGKTGQALAIVLTSLAFALLHTGQLAHAWVPLLVIFGVGLTLTTLRARTKSVAVGVIVHMGYNFTLFSLFYIGTHGFKQLPG